MQSKTLKDIYKFYLEKGGTLPYKIYREVCEEFNIRAMDQIIYEGRVLILGYHLATIRVVRIDRNFKKPVINWGESAKRKRELIKQGKTPKTKDNPDGEPWLIYWTDDWFVRFYWNKAEANVKGKYCYRFEPTKGKKGNTTKLINFLRRNRLAYLNYERKDEF